MRIVRPRLVNARIRSKLGLILVVPILAIVVLAAFRLSDAEARAADAARVGALTRLSADVSNLSQQVHLERMSAAVLASTPTATPAAYNKQIERTDAVVAAYTKHRGALGDVPVGVRDRLQRIDTQLQVLGTIRKDVSSRQGVSVDEIVLRYGVIIDDLVSYREALGQVTTDPALSDGLRAAAAFSKAKASVAEQEAVVYAALKAGPLDASRLPTLLATLTSQQEAFVAFALSANVQQSEIVDNAIAGDAVQMADDMTRDLQRTAGPAAPVTADDAVGVYGAVNDLMRWTEQQLDNGLIDDAAKTSATVQRQVIQESVIIIVVLLTVIGLALVTARSMIVSLRRLRQSALTVAEHDLPAAVSQLRDAQTIQERTPEQIADQVLAPPGSLSKDEIGEVARAFTIVHREAVRVAAEQAILRNSVSSMFLNLARRSQTLVDRMIGQLDRIERTEEDPKRLAQLFQLDHLATRMRRNDENVLVLAGADTTPPRRQDAPLLDVMRAAQSEIELYERIEFGAVDDDVQIAALAVNDAVRLLAELLDNATRFSPPNTPVVLTGHRMGHRAIIQIEDHGLGISPDMLESYNSRLVEPPPVDIGAFRLMGIAVVGRLAYRHSITVQLRNNVGGGTVAEILLPGDLLVMPRSQRHQVMPVPRRGGALTAHAQSPASTDNHALNNNRQTNNHVALGDTLTTGRPAIGFPARQTTPTRPPAWPLPAPPVQPPIHRPPPEPMQTPTVGLPTLNRWMELAPPEPVWTPTIAADDTAEVPIFREIEATWFKERGHSAIQGWPLSEAQPPAPAPVAPPGAAGQATPPLGAPAASTQPAQPMAADSARWRTRADEGWRAASAAENPPISGSTRSGLPKRSPQAQLVPGGVTPRPTKLKRPSAEELRGLLSSYQRGVQRGRQDGGASSDHAQANEEKHR